MVIQTIGNTNSTVEVIGKISKTVKSRIQDYVILIEFGQEVDVETFTELWKEFNKMQDATIVHQLLNSGRLKIN